ncbi:DUF6270 domain-containing protein [Azospirillum sp.]|uniref:DUF6270 domain-containing protein n=1 Tax=Azospirillum sp. TaxID=34012 RepID=UPI002D46A470|nr:DUF6270 domain-containing protein [Azospirillum sp.]HYD70451.1 DUF6270 domain-containing protein [Azospirillum sp.]
MTAALQRIAVVGSCITQQALAAADIHRVDRVADYARASIASLTPPPSCPVLPLSILDGLGLPPGVHHWLAAELAKTIPGALADARPDVLILDLIEERFDLLVLDSGLIINESLDFATSGLAALPPFAGARRVLRLSDEAWALWEAGLERLRRHVAETPLADARIVLHRAVWASQMRTPAGCEPLPDETFIMLGRSGSRAAHNALLARCHDRFLQAFPTAAVVEAPPDACLADPDHRWGLSPFHYVPAYYEAIAAQWRAMGLGHTAP